MAALNGEDELLLDDDLPSKAGQHATPAAAPATQAPKPLRHPPELSARSSPSKRQRLASPLFPAAAASRPVKGREDEEEAALHAPISASELGERLSPSKPAGPQSPAPVPAPAVRRPGDQESFTREGPWLAMCLERSLPPFEAEAGAGGPGLLTCNVRLIKTGGIAKRQKVPELVVCVKSVAQHGADVALTVRDPSGELAGTMHSGVLAQHKGQVVPGAVLVLRGLALYIPNGHEVFLVVNPENVAKVYPPWTPPPPQAASALAPGAAPPLPPYLPHAEMLAFHQARLRQDRPRARPAPPAVAARPPGPSAARPPTLAAGTSPSGARPAAPAAAARSPAPSAARTAPLASPPPAPARPAPQAAGAALSMARPAPLVSPLPARPAPKPAPLPASPAAPLPGPLSQAPPRLVVGPPGASSASASTGLRPAPPPPGRAPQATRPPQPASLPPALPHHSAHTLAASSGTAAQPGQSGSKVADEEEEGLEADEGSVYPHAEDEGVQAHEEEDQGQGQEGARPQAEPDDLDALDDFLAHCDDAALLAGAQPGSA